MKMDNKDEMTASFSRGVRIAKQTIVVAGMLVVNANIDRYVTAASFLNTLAAVHFCGKITAEKGHQQMIVDTSTARDRCFFWQFIQNIFFAAKHQFYFFRSKCFFHSKNNVPLFFQRRIDERKIRQVGKAFLNFAVGVHKAGNTAFDPNLGCLSGDVF